MTTKNYTVVSVDATSKTMTVAFTQDDVTLTYNVPVPTATETMDGVVQSYWPSAEFARRADAGAQVAAAQAIIGQAQEVGAPPALTPDQHRTAALAAGVQVTSTSTPALNSTYGLSMQDQINITGLQTSLLAGVPWIGYFRDINRNKITMTAAQFTAVATVILNFIVAIDAAYELAEGGGAWVAPAQPGPIA